jgi:hypothetical protein
MSYPSHQELLPEIARSANDREAHENAGKNPKKLLIPIGEYPIKDVLHKERNDAVRTTKDNHADKGAEESSFVGFEIL